jgi:murein DD-endopeptidase MepM/ murein hydrolase activator NlpD
VRITPSFSPRYAALSILLAGLAACATPAPAPVYYPLRPPPPAAPPPSPVSGAFTPDPELRLCSGITVRNAPFADSDRRVPRFSPFVEVAPGLVVAMVPTNQACLTSGYGPRDRSFHRGLDLQSRPPTMVHAAAAGRVLEAEFQGGYGNYLVISHGQGVFTRYAHLEAFGPGIAPGAEVSFGAPLGMMGGTAIPPVSPHLHYEIMVGDYMTARRSFGLDAVDPFSLPPAGLPPAPSAEESERIALLDRDPAQH